MLPDGGGYELAAQLRERLTTEPIIAAVTSLEDDQPFARAREAGLSAYFTKPFWLESLRDWLELVVLREHDSAE